MSTGNKSMEHQRFYSHYSQHPELRTEDYCLRKFYCPCA